MIWIMMLETHKINFSLLNNLIANGQNGREKEELNSSKYCSKHTKNTKHCLINLNLVPTLHTISYSTKSVLSDM